MKQVKTLTINGNTYEIADPDAAHIDDGAVSPDTTWSSRKVNDIAGDILIAMQGIVDDQSTSNGTTWSSRKVADALETLLDDTTLSSDSGWSGKHIVDRLCPSFTRSGATVTCRPVEGYPLEVETVIPVSTEGIDTLTLCHAGKNLFDVDASGWTGVNNGQCTKENGSLKVVGFAVNTHIIPIKPSTTYTVSYKSTRTGTKGGGIYARAYKADGKTTDLFNMNSIINGKQIFTTPADAVSIQFMFYGNQDNSNNTDYSVFTEIQLEQGNTRTAYEPYRGGEISLELGQTVYGGYMFWDTGLLLATHDSAGQPLTLPTTQQLEVPQVLGLSGVNTLYSDTGDTVVIGRADPVAIIETLSDTVSTLLEG